jgi:AraC-like DNA-binding protein
MSVVYRADDEPERSRTEYWLDVVDRTFDGIELRMPGGFDERDMVRIGDFGAVRVAELSFSKASVAQRTQAHINRSSTERFKLDVQVRGPLRIEHNGRQVAQGPRDLTFVDLTRPARWQNPTSQVVAVMFPRALLPLPEDELAQLGGTHVSADRGMAALVSSLARQLPDHLDDVDAASRARIGTTIIDLTTALVMERVERGDAAPPETRQRALLTRIHAYIETNLDNPDLSPRAIAASHFVSVRTLHKLFEGDGASVAEHVRRRRLERSRADLLDPTLRLEPVSRIAARWGFASPAQFSRAFRSAYGLPPSDYRILGMSLPRHAGGAAVISGTLGDDS